MKRLSITDVAKQLNVSKTLVSFILNNRAEEMRISPELVEKVKKYIEEVGYRPNPIAKSLRTGKTNIIALMVENIADPFFAAIARLIENRVYENGYKIIYCSTDNNIEKTKELLSTFRERNVDGYIISPPEGIEGEIQSLTDAGIPVVLFDRHLPGVATDVVEVDNRKSTFNATSYLIGKGYAHIAFVTFSSSLTQMKARLAGYKEAISAAGLDTCILEIDFNQNDEYIINPIADFFRENKQLDAVVFGALQAGTNGLKAFRKIGYAIPGDIAAISYDDCDVFQLYSPSITAIAQPIHKIADAAIDLLIKRLKAPASNPKTLVMETELIHRKSSR